jgi:hypothetical protein
MKLYVAVCALALLGACSPKVAPVTEPGPEAAAKRFPLPDCATVEAEDAGAAGWTHKDCRLMSSDSAGLAFEARYTAPVEGQDTTVTIQVVAPGDATLQTITEKMGGTFGAPRLQDIDGDGRDELLVPLETGNVNTTWAIWRATGAETQYKRIEELSGVDITRTDDGYIASAGRSSANSWSVAFWKFDGEDLEPIATADVTAQGEADKITGTTCVVTDQGGLDEAGLDPKAAETKFCAYPVVSGIFK